MKQVNQIFEKVAKELDAFVKEVDVEEVGDKELRKADMEARRGENMIKHRDEIMNRPKKHWMKNEKEKKEVKKQSKEELKDIGQRFEDELGKDKVEKKKQRKIGGSKFAEDIEKDKEEKVNKP